ncbi:MAG TPA: hypothetical protein VMO00_00855 [Methylomirabilota bacterium]|nr:hypothetical protein [Methylomirabilota bacterium]
MITLLSKQTQIWMILVSLLLGFILIAWPKSSFSQSVASQERVANVLAIDKLAIQDGTVTGELRNKSSHALRDVQLLINYVWLWKNERHPGKDDPGRSIYYSVPGELSVGGSNRFQYTPSPPLPKRMDGSFQISVSIAGYTEVIPQSR